MSSVMRVAVLALATSALATSTLATWVWAAPAAAGGADKALAALLACSPKFFFVLANSKAAFGPATVSPVRDVDALTTLDIGRADFAAPAEAYGLHIDGFIESARGRDAKLESFWFGFRTVESPSVVVHTIGEAFKDADFREREDRYGWLIELEPRWHTDGDGSAIEHRYPVRMIEVSPIATKAGVGSVIRCGLALSRAGGMTKLPPVADLFQAQDPAPVDPKPDADP